MSKNAIHKKTFLTWVAIYPVITLIFVFFGDWLMLMPLALRTLVLALILVPLLSYVLLPFLFNYFDRWINS